MTGGARALGAAALGAALPRLASAQADTVLRLAGSEPSTLDPVHVRDTSAAGYVTEIFAGLTRIGPDLTPEPDLAESWNVSGDGLTYTFHLRPQAAFHDGRPLTSDDVVWSWRRALDPATQSLAAPSVLGAIEGAAEFAAGEADEISGVRAAGPRQLEVTLTSPSPIFTSFLAYGPSMVVDRRTVTAEGDWWRRPNGSGPYELLAWRAHELLRLHRAATVPWRPGGPARADFLQLDPGEGMLRYENGELDFVAVGGANVQRFRDPREPRHSELRSTPDLAIQYVGFNTALPPFDDVHVRRALALAVDRERIARVTLRGTEREAHGMIPPGLGGHRPSFRGLSFDPAAARAELARSSYGSASRLPPLAMTVPGRGVVAGGIVQSIVQPWRRELGVDVTVELREFNEFVTVLDDPVHELQLFLLGWAADVPDAIDFTERLFGADQADNSMRLNDPIVEALLARARRAGDDWERLAAYRRLEDWVTQRAVVVPLFFPVTHELVQPWVQGYHGLPMTREWLTDLTIDREAHAA